jgi:hypothetical protein
VLISRTAFEHDLTQYEDDVEWTISRCIREVITATGANKKQNLIVRRIRFMYITSASCLKLKWNQIRDMALLRGTVALFRVKFPLYSDKGQRRKPTAKLSEKFPFCCNVGIYTCCVVNLSRRPASETPAGERYAATRASASACCSIGCWLAATLFDTPTKLHVHYFRWTLESSSYHVECCQTVLKLSSNCASE